MAGKSWSRMLFVIVAAVFAWSGSPALAAGACNAAKSKTDCTAKTGCFWNGKICATKAGGAAAKAPKAAKGTATTAKPGKGPAKATAGKGAAKPAAGKPAAKPATAATKAPAAPAKAAEPAAAPAATEPTDAGDMPAGEEDGAVEEETEGSEDF